TGDRLLGPAGRVEQAGATTQIAEGRSRQLCGLGGEEAGDYEAVWRHSAGQGRNYAVESASECRAATRASWERAAGLAARPGDGRLQGGDFGSSGRRRDPLHAGPARDRLLGPVARSAGNDFRLRDECGRAW